VDALEKWLNQLEGYFFFHNLFDRENITFALLKDIPDVKNGWKNYCDQNSTEEHRMFGDEPTLDSFMDVMKEQYYHVGNYHDQYMIWSTLH
jgi:hypothetical protein